MAARIILVRHGPSALEDRPRALDRAGVQRWLDAYDSAGIRAGAQPPQALTRLAAEATHLVASDLPRAIESAERLTSRRTIQVSELLRESPLTIPHWPTRLPLEAWAILMYVSWGGRIVRGVDAGEADRARAASAAEWLAGIVADGSVALVVTHRVFRRLVASQLVLRGWTNADGRRGYRHWSFWDFSGPNESREEPVDLLAGR